MPTRITVRYLGSEVGKKVARPDTKGEVLELAAKRLNLSTPASRIFAASPTSGLYCTIRSSALPTDGRRGRDTATRRDVRATYPNKH